MCECICVYVSASVCLICVPRHVAVLFVHTLYLCCHVQHVISAMYLRWPVPSTPLYVYVCVCVFDAWHGCACSPLPTVNCLHILICYRIVVVLDKMIRIFNFTRIPQELHQILTAPNPRGKQGGALYVCVCVCVCVYVCVCCVYMCVYVCVCCVYMCICVCMCVCVYVYVCMCVCDHCTQ